jgi:hypothetical protein
MKALALLLLLSLQACVIRERVRVEYRTLPPKPQKIELQIEIVPAEEVPEEEPEWKKRENLASFGSDCY